MRKCFSPRSINVLASGPTKLQACLRTKSRVDTASATSRVTSARTGRLHSKRRQHVGVSASMQTPFNRSQHCATFARWPPQQLQGYIRPSSACRLCPLVALCAPKQLRRQARERTALHGTRKIGTNRALRRWTRRERHAAPGSDAAIIAHDADLELQQ